MSASIIKGAFNRVRLIGKNSQIVNYGRLSVISSISRSKFERNVAVAARAQVSNSTIGAHTSIGTSSRITHANIGSFCAISWNVTINAISHPLEHLSISAFPYVENFGALRVAKGCRPSMKRVVIGSDVWIGAQSVIMPGVTVGHGAVVGAGSIVTKNVPPFAIVAGNPSRLLRYRFDSDVVNLILESRWWDWDDKRLAENIDLFLSAVDNTILSKLNNISQ